MDYKTSGVCSQKISFDIDNENKVRNVSFIGGCSGNLQGIGRLIDGMEVHEAIERLQDIRCGFKSTSCPDQLAKALSQAINA
ncbi:MAG: TIGR03905 family TSCPD domain-containing protein [Lachnospiraceae bacterium]|nr:TIGR03905 family TSCPD domain-containing protein [Lachnospiraceae bacterium]